MLSRYRSFEHAAEGQLNTTYICMLRGDLKDDPIQVAILINVLSSAIHGNNKECLAILIELCKNNGEILSTGIGLYSNMQS